MPGPSSQFQKSPNFDWYYNLFLDIMECGTTLEIGLETPALKDRLTKDSIPAHFCHIKEPSDLREIDENQYSNIALINCLDFLPPQQAQQAVLEIARIAGNRIFAIVSAPEYPYQEPGRAKTRKDRTWWEDQFFKQGFRRMSCTTRVLSPDACLRSQFKTVLLLERLPSHDNNLPHLLTSHKPRDIARAEQYAFCAQKVRPNDRILHLSNSHLEAGCILADLSRCTSITNTSDLSNTSHRQYFDFVISHNWFHPAEIRKSIGAIKSRLVPGGRFIAIYEPTQSEPHEHLNEIQHALREQFLLDKIYSHPSNNAIRHLDNIREVPSSESIAKNFGDSDTAIFTCIKDPHDTARPQYQETAFPDIGAQKNNPFSYKEHYENPWIVHSMATFGFRADSKQVLKSLAEETLKISSPGSPDRGAALCVSLYQLLDHEGHLPEPKAIENIKALVDSYCRKPNTNPHTLRWKISLRFALGKAFSLMAAFDAALQQFEKCIRYDPLQFSPHLATKTTEAHFLIGWINLFQGNKKAAKRAWNRGIQFGDRLMKTNMKTILVDKQNPNRFDVGDGMREFILAFEKIALCVNGINFIKQKQERPFGVGQIWNAFHVERRYKRPHLVDDIDGKTHSNTLRLLHLTKRLNKKNAGNIAIYGTGEIGNFLATELQKRNFKVTVAIDSFAAKGQRLGDLTVLSPSEAAKKPIDAIIIASEAFKKAMIRTLKTEYLSAGKKMPYTTPW